MPTPRVPPLVLPMWAGTPPGVTAPEAVTPFADPALAAAEQQWVTAAHDRTLHWWLTWWPLAVAVLLGGRAAYRAFLDATETPPPTADLATAGVGAAWRTRDPRRIHRVVPWPGAVPPPRRRLDRDPVVWVPDRVLVPVGAGAAETPVPGRVVPPRAPAGTAERPPGTRQPAETAVGPLPAPRHPTWAPHEDEHGRRAARDWAAESAAIRMREWADGMRDDVRARVVMAVRLRMTPAQLAADLAARWGHTHADVARIAATELTSAAAAAFLMRRPAGSWVWVPPIGDGKVCDQCKTRLERHWFQTLPVAPAHPTGVEWYEWLWPAKPWQAPDGRRVPAIPQHPWCRHRLEGGVVLNPTTRR